MNILEIITSSASAYYFSSVVIALILIVLDIKYFANEFRWLMKKHEVPIDSKMSFMVFMILFNIAVLMPVTNTLFVLITSGRLITTELGKVVNNIKTLFKG